MLDWSPEVRSASLTAAFRHAVDLAREAEAWYATRRPAKKHWGRALRVGAILLGATAAIIPILSEIDSTQGKSAISPGWASIAVAGAAALVALDHFFGFSSGWMRFMTSGQTITRLRHNFEYTWNIQCAALSGAPTAAQVCSLLEVARGLVVAVDDVIADETNQWVVDFRGSLERADRDLGTTERRLSTDDTDARIT